MEQHRIAPRQRILKAGMISFGSAAIDCTVRNISATGAAVDVVTPLFIPDRFTLFMPTDLSDRATSSGARNGVRAWHLIKAIYLYAIGKKAVMEITVTKLA